MELHRHLEPVAGLIGTWYGSGNGEYPTITPFEYTEELVFTNIGKPFLAYQQRTWSPAGIPMHVETGYLRFPGSEAVEFTIAQPTGQTELADGSLEIFPEGFRIELASPRVLNSPTAKQVAATQRTYRLIGETLTTSFAMAAVGITMTHHLSSTLAKR